MSVDPRTNCLAPTFWRGGVVDCGRCEPCQSKPPRMSDADFQRAMGREPADDRDAWKARAEKAEAELADRIASDGKYYVKARVYGAIAAEYQKALQAFADRGEALAQAALDWRHSNDGGVPTSAVGHIGVLLNAEALRAKAESRATQAEAQAATMRNVLGRCLPEGEKFLLAERREVLSADAGRTLLAELEALREVERFAREASEKLGLGWGELRDAIDAVDAARTKTSGDTPNHPVPASGGRGNAEAAKNETAPLADRSKSADCVDAARKGE